MKTAMQEVLGLVEQMFANANTQEVESAMNDVINIITQEGLEKEKEQIIDFHVMLMKHGLEQEGNVTKWDYNLLKDEAEEYYNQTYNQNK